MLRDLMKTRLEGIAGRTGATAAETFHCSLTTQVEVKRHEAKSLCFGDQNDLSGRSIKYHFQKNLTLPVLLRYLSESCNLPFSILPSSEHRLF